MADARTKKQLKINNVAVFELSTIALLRRVAQGAMEHGLDSPIPFGCVSCGDGSRIMTHEVKGYGGLCADHADGEARAKPYPWAAEGRELTRRGLVLSES